MTRFQKFLVIATLALFAGCTKKTPDSPELGQNSTDTATHGLPSLTTPTTPGAGDSSGSVVDSLKSDTSAVSPSTSLPEPRKKSIGKKGKRRKGKGYSRRGKRKKGKRYARRGRSRRKHG